METIKSYTDLEQSKKLAKILPIESADMWHHGFFTPRRMCKIEYNPPAPYHSVTPQWDCPCWSLAALLEEIPDTITNIVGEDLKLHIDKDKLKYSLFYENEYTGDMFEIETELYDDIIDACYELILKLHELNLL